eukprot:scaffold5747_cov128-Isochrysis_galbana.AAC.8
MGMSSCSTSRIWAGGHLRASVNWITSGVFTMMMSRAAGHIYDIDIHRHSTLDAPPHGGDS